MPCHWRPIFSIGNSPSTTTPIEPCVHTLYVATDEGFEHVSDRLGLDPEFELPYDETWDSYTDSLKFPESVKFAIYIPAPSGFGAYVGFAAIRAE